jgi:hypothetical protein
MPISIVTAEQRLARRPKINIALFGPHGVGKTSQLKTLPPEDTLFINLEGGELAIEDWGGDMIDVRRDAAAIGCHPWELARALACLMAGADPAAGETGVNRHYSRKAFDLYAGAIGPAEQFAKYNAVFIDSISVASRMCFAWSQTQPEAFSEKTGKPDNRGAYGLLGLELMAWLTTCQHIPEKSIIVVGGLDVHLDDFKRPVFEVQIEGSKAGRELPGIFDEIITMGLFTVDESGQAKLDLKNGKERAFICQLNNGFGVPAKDRSGRLDMLEAPDLGAVMKKIAQGKRKDAAMQTGLPSQAASPAPDMPAPAEAQPSQNQQDTQEPGGSWKSQL